MVRGTLKPVETFAHERPLKDGRILLVEDAPITARLLSHVMRTAGAEVTLAENGQQGRDFALRALRARQPFDLILMDMQMPLMDGYEATRSLRSSGYRGPIVAITAHSLEGDREKCIAAGCDDYATKPIDRERLIAICRASLAHKAPAAALPSGKQAIDAPTDTSTRTHG
jgi:CheY-like chemotaxis protein